MENTIDVQQATTEQLKALAFDMMLERDRLNANLDVIGQELDRRTKEDTPKPKDKPDTK